MPRPLCRQRSPDDTVMAWPQPATATSTRPATAPTARGRRPARRGICLRAVAAGTCGVRLALGRAGLGPGDGRRLRRPTPSTTVVVAQPLPSDALGKIDGKYPVFRRVVRSGDGTALSEDLHAAYNRVFSKIGGATCLLQPMDTRSHGCLTRSDLKRAGPRRAEGGRQERNDILQGNATLGAMLWKELRQRLGTSVETASNP